MQKVYVVTENNAVMVAYQDVSDARRHADALLKRKVKELKDLYSFDPNYNVEQVYNMIRVSNRSLDHSRHMYIYRVEAVSLLDKFDG